MSKSDLPFGSEFSPTQIDLSAVLELVKQYGGDQAGFEGKQRKVFCQKPDQRLSKYGVPYEKFYIQVTTDEKFVRSLRQSFPTWERDLNAWEYYLEELHEWLGHLESISKA